MPRGWTRQRFPAILGADAACTASVVRRPRTWQLTTKSPGPSLSSAALPDSSGRSSPAPPCGGMMLFSPLLSLHGVVALTARFTRFSTAIHTTLTLSTNTCSRAVRDEHVPVGSPDSDFPLPATTSDERRASTSTRSRSAPGHTASRSLPAGGSAHTRKAGNPLATPPGVAEGMDETTISSHTGLGCGLYRFCCQEAQDVAPNHYESWAFAVLGSPAGF